VVVLNAFRRPIEIEAGRPATLPFSAIANSESRAQSAEVPATIPQLTLRTRPNYQPGLKGTDMGKFATNSNFDGALHRARTDRRNFLVRSLALGLTPVALLGGGLQSASASGGVNRSLHRRWQIDSRTLVIADNLIGNWKTLDPAFLYEGAPTAAMFLMYEPLYQLPNPERPDVITPLLAESMPEFSSDGLTATIPIRKGVHFQHTGTEMTAPDWVFSWNRVKYTGFQGSFLASDYWGSVEAEDDYTLRLIMAAPNVALTSVLTALQLGVTDSAAVKALGGTDAPPSSEEDSPEVEANTEVKKTLDQSSVGTGPFTLKRFDPNTEVVLEVDPNYWGEASKLDRVIWRNVVDPNAQLESVQLGEADIAYQMNIDQLPTVQEDPNLQVLESVSEQFMYLAMNLREDWGGPVATKQVRQALSYAIDYDSINNDLLGGAANRPAVPIPLPLPGTEEVQALAYHQDLARAQELWDASGAGEVTIEIAYASDGIGYGGVNLETLSTKIQADLERIDGLSIQLAPMPNTERSANYRAGEFQMVLAPWSPDYPDVDGFASAFYRTDTAAAKRVGFSDPAIDELLDQGISEPDPVKRAEIYAELQRQVLEEAVYIVLYQPRNLKPASAKVTGVTPHFQYQLHLRNAAKSD
jgi:peptide/nickel transport system substrate-binding protein